MRPVLKNTIYILAFILLASLLFYFIAAYPYAFNYEVEITHYNLLISFCALVLEILVIYSFFHETLYTHTGSWLALTCMLLFFCIFLSKDYANEYLTVLIVITSAFVSMSITASSRLIFSVAVYIFIIYLYEVGLGLYQFATIDPYTVDRSLLIQGSLQNSGIYACYLVVHLPFANYLVFGIKDNWPFLTNLSISLFAKRLIYISFLFILFFLVAYTQSRTAIIAFLFTLLLLWGRFCWSVYTRNKRKVLFHAAAFLIVVALITTGYYLYMFKHLSAVGRVLGWQISITHLNDHFWLGTGIGRFSWYYPQWQMEYFKTHPNPGAGYFLSASESYIIFNEYLQLFIEAGAIKSGILLFLLYYFLKGRSRQYGKLLHAAKISMASILCCAFTSYPFHSTPILFLFGFCCLVVSFTREDGLFKGKKVPGKNLLNVLRCASLVALGISICYSFTCIKRIIATNKLTQLRGEIMYTREETKKVYSELYPALYRDGKFLTGYGEFLIQDSIDYLQGLQLLEEARKSFISQRTVNAIAEGYKEFGDKDKAIQNYEWLSFYLPNRFKIKFQLLKLYEASKYTLKAKQLAHIILTMPVKVPSQDVFDIRNETREIVTRLNKSVQELHVELK